MFNVQQKARSPQSYSAFGTTSYYLRNPNNTQQYLAHKAIDYGADLVIGHHPNVLQGVETYKGKLIAYSLGNFAFGGNKNPGDKNTAILQVRMTFHDAKFLFAEGRIIPCRLSSVSHTNNYQPIPLQGTEKEDLLQEIVELSPDACFPIKSDFMNVF